MIRSSDEQANQPQFTVQVLKRELCEKINALESIPTSLQADEAWGEVTHELIRLSANRQQENDFVETELPGRWGDLSLAQINARHGRWMKVRQALLPPVYRFMKEGNTRGSDSAWAGRAANLLALMASNEPRDGVTLQECLDWVDHLCRREPELQALKAQQMHYLGRVFVKNRDFPQAGEVLCQAREVFEQLSDDSHWKNIGLCQLWDTLGECFADSGKLNQAVEAFQESIRRKQVLGDLHGEAISRGQLGQTYLDNYILDLAEEELQEDLNLVRIMKDRHGETVCLTKLAEVALVRAEDSVEPHPPELGDAHEYLDQALSLSREIRNPIGEGLALVGLARELLIPLVVDENDNLRGLEYAQQGYQILARSSGRVEWSSYAQIWQGWGEAKRATTMRQLDHCDDRFYGPAVAKLHDAQIPTLLAEFNFQRAKMWLLEGRRIAGVMGETTTDHLKQAMHHLCEAVSHADQAGASTMTERYSRFARNFDPDLWIHAVLGFRETVGALRRENQNLRNHSENTRNALLFLRHEIGQPMLVLSLRGNSDPDLFDQQTWANIARLKGVQNLMTSIVSLEAKNDGDQTATLPPLVDLNVGASLLGVLEIVRTAHYSSNVVFDHYIVDEIVWRTATDWLEVIVYNLLQNAAKYARRAGGGTQPRVKLAASRQGTMLQIDVCNTGPPLEFENRQWVFQPGATTAKDASRNSPHGYGLYLARYFARRLNGDIVVIGHPENPWTTHLRVTFHPPD